MRAAIYNKFGGTDVLEISDIPKPQVKANEVLVRVRAAAVNPKDTFVRKGRFRLFTGKRFPMQTGYDFAGEIAAVASGSLHLKKDNQSSVCCSAPMLRLSAAGQTIPF